MWIELSKGTIGSLLSSIVLWAAGKLFGEERVYRIVERYGRWLLLRTSDVIPSFWDRREEAARYSFLMSAPIIAGAGTLKLTEAISEGMTD